MSIIDEVREAVLAIPAGSVACYGDIAKQIGTGPRQVGQMMVLLDDGVPWWRVVHADDPPPAAADEHRSYSRPKGRRCVVRAWT